MKLELKHLAPYLPYGLKMMRIENNRNINTTELSIEFLNEQRWDKVWKPILRPLSDLTSLGIDDIPINEHSINMLIGKDNTYGDVMFNHYQGELTYEIDSEDYSNTEYIDFSLFETVRNELLKGHYDIFGLIEKKLAIDINTL